MAKKKNKPDFSRPKEEVLEEKKQKAAEKAREAAEEAQLQNSNQELADQIRIIKEQKALEERIAADKKRKKDLMIKAAIAAAAVILIASVTIFFATLKAPDYYKLDEHYDTMALSMTNSVPKAEITEVASLVVKQNAGVKKSGKKRGSGPAQPTDAYGIGKAADVFGGGKIVK